MQYECFPDRTEMLLREEAEETTKTFPKFYEDYQSWYSELKILIEVDKSHVFREY